MIGRVGYHTPMTAKRNRLSSATKHDARPIERSGRRMSNPGATARRHDGSAPSARYRPRPGGIQPLDAADAIVHDYLVLAARETGAPSAFLAQAELSHDWRITHVYSASDRQEFRRGAPVAIRDTPDAAVVTVDGQHDLGHVLRVTLDDDDGRACALLCTVDPTPDAFPPGNTERLARIGSLLSTYLAQRRREQALRESDDRYRTIVDATAEGIMLRLADGCIGAVNRSAEQLIGVPAAQLIGRISLPIRHVVIDHDGTRHEDAEPPGLASVRNGESFSNVLVELHRPDDTVIWVSTNARPLVELGASLPYASVISFVDVSERLQAVAAMRESEERFRSLSAASPVGIFHANLSGIILYVNPKCAAILGHAAEELLDRRVADVINGAGAAAELAAWHSATVNGHTFERELLIRRGDGTARWINLCSAPLRGAQTELTGFVGTIEDISARKQSETESQEQQIRLTILNSIATEIAAGTSVKRIIDRAVDRLAEHFPDRRVIYGLIDERLRLRVVRSAQPPHMPSMRGQRRDLTVVPRFLQALRAGYIAVDDVERDERMTPVAGRIVKGGSRAFVDVLLRVGDEDVGMLGLDAAEPHHWTEHEIATLTDVAGYLAVALSHARHEEGRRRASLEARRTAERFQSLVQHSSDVITIFGPDTSRVYISPSVEAILGYSAAEMLPLSQAQITHPDELPAIEQAFREMMARPGAPITTQFRARHRDGSWRWMESVATNLLDDPAVHGVVSNTRDISERHRAEEALRESEERFRSAFEHALAGMALTDRDGRFVWVNESLCRMLGFTKDELLSGSFHTILHPDDLALAQADSAQLFTGEQASYQRERRFRHKSGEVLWGLLSASVLFDGEGRPAQVIGQVQDITQRQRMEAALRASDERYRALVSNSSDIIAVLDANGIVRSMSDAVELVLGYTPGELIGRTNEALCHPEDRPRLRFAFARSVRSPGVKRQIELRFRHKNGSWRWLEIMTTALLGDPAVGGIVTDARDITERRQAAAALQEANVQLEELNRAKSDFVSLVSHEFRTPLTGILGFSELIRDEEFALPEIKEFANDINADAQRLGRMIDQLLDLDRMQSGRIQLQRAPVSLNTIARAVAQQFRAASPSHRLTLNLDDKLPGMTGDRDKLIQVVTNLVGNAIKYSPDGGEVLISSRAEGQSIRLDVRDQGVGIPAEDLERVFDRYARVEGGAGRFIKGIGLGLPIAREIVELHGGRIWAESTIGQGSTFCVVLPVNEPAEE